jgi:hypothetical protein
LAHIAIGGDVTDGFSIAKDGVTDGFKVDHNTPKIYPLPLPDELTGFGFKTENAF